MIPSPHYRSKLRNSQPTVRFSTGNAQRLAPEAAPALGRGEPDADDSDVGSHTIETNLADWPALLLNDQ
jgi:hypothetical protein